MCFLSHNTIKITQYNVKAERQLGHFYSQIKQCPRQKPGERESSAQAAFTVGHYKFLSSRNMKAKQIKEL